MESDIGKFLCERIDAGDLPSAAYLVAEKGEIVLHEAVGNAVVEPEEIAAGPDTIYDLASLTKPLVTALLAARSIDAGAVRLAHQLTRHIGPSVPADKRHITISDLLAHASGLPAWQPFYLLVDTPDRVPSAILETPLETNGPAVVYSDLNYILLQSVLGNVFGAGLDRVMRSEVAEPLGLASTFFRPPAEVLSRTAASEKGNQYERQMCIDQGYLDGADTENRQGAFRTGVIRGEVHDGNAYFMDGVAGHAGLFSTARETFEIAQQFLPRFTQILKPETCELFHTLLAKGGNEERSFGFQLASSPDSTAGDKLSRTSFGHTGFTGTSLWIDPVKERILILLTNRTHAHGLPFVNINSVRRRFHDMAVEYLDGNR